MGFWKVKFGTKPYRIELLWNEMNQIFWAWFKPTMFIILQFVLLKHLEPSLTLRTTQYIANQTLFLASRIPSLPRIATIKFAIVPFGLRLACEKRTRPCLINFAEVFYNSLWRAVGQAGSVAPSISDAKVLPATSWWFEPPTSSLHSGHIPRCMAPPHSPIK